MIKHTGRNRVNHSGVSLGGIGTGKVDFCPNGKFTNLTTNNNVVMQICVDRATSDYVVAPQGIPGAFLACFVEGFGARILKTHSFEGYETLKAGEIRYQGLLPRALVRYPEMAGVTVELEAFSSIILDDDSEHYKDSSLPAAVFLFRLHNRSSEARRVSVAMSWHNLVGLGGYPDAQINDLRGNFVAFEEGEGWKGLWFASSRRKVDPRVEGNYVLTVGGGEGLEVTYMAGWSPGVGRQDDFWTVFSREGKLNNLSDRGGLGAICATILLKANEEREIPIVLAWYFPNFIGDIDERPNYGHAYNNWFSSSKEVAKYVLTNYRRLLKKTRFWQKELLDSSLLRWFAVKLITDIFPLVTNSLYTQDFRFASYEAHPTMRGCLGTIDQRAASNSIYTMCFPKLSKSELALFAEQQIDENSHHRFCKHWNFRTGHRDFELDCEGSIRHEVGWDHLEGGTGSSQWPDIPPVFVLQCYEYIAWTGDKELLDFVYPRVKRALEYESRLDQNNDGVADVSGPGSLSYDNKDYPFYGASPYIASLQLAALEAGRRMAKLKSDGVFISWCEEQASKIRKTMEEVLWSKELGHFYMWYDELAENWNDGTRSHGRSSDGCFVSQLAGGWFANLLDFGYIVDREKVHRTLSTIADKNDRSVGGCPANIVTKDGKISSSWPYYAEVYYAANAIYENEVDAGFDCLHKIYHVMHELDKSPWDVPLGWDYHLYPGNLPDNLPRKSSLWKLLNSTDRVNRWATWGRWYMTNPASWFVLLAIAGFSLDLLNSKLVIAPSLPRAIGGGKRARRLPIFMPGFWGRVSYEQRTNSLWVGFEITRFLREEPLRFRKFVTKVPRGIYPERAALSFRINGKELLSQEVIPDPLTRRVEIEVPFLLSGVGDRLECGLRWKLA